MTKFTIFKVRSGKTITKSRVELECRGLGTIDDPLILDPSTKFPKLFYIENSELHLRMHECNVHSIGIFNSQNISIKNSSLNSVYFSNCSNKIIDSCLNIKKLGMNMSNNNMINRSTIVKLKISHSNDNTIQECTIAKIKYRNNNENSFIKNEISEKVLLKTDKQPTFASLNLSKIIIATIEITFYVVMFIFLIMSRHTPFMFWAVIFVLIFFIFVAFVPQIIARKIIEKRKQKEMMTKSE